MSNQRIDHINLRIPEVGVERALEFYVDLLGFEPLKLDAFRAGERTSFFVRIGETSMINLRPVDTFEEPSGERPRSLLYCPRRVGRGPQAATRGPRGRDPPRGDAVRCDRAGAVRLRDRPVRVQDRTEGTGRSVTVPAQRRVRSTTTSREDSGDSGEAAIRHASAGDRSGWRSTVPGPSGVVRQPL